jgi:hypothetical protein
VVAAHSGLHQHERVTARILDPGADFLKLASAVIYGQSLKGFTLNNSVNYFLLL